jgi:hypothetical protein
MKGRNNVQRYHTKGMLGRLGPRIGSMPHIARKNCTRHGTANLETVRERTDACPKLCTNDSMQSPNHQPITDASTVAPGHAVPEQAPATPQKKDSAERYDDPAQAEELERQQDA